MEGKPIRASRTPRGFSLLEILAVVTIMGIMAMVIVPRIGYHTNKAKNECCEQYRADINAASEAYWMKKGVFPPSVDKLYPDFYPDPLPVCPVTHQPYKIDAGIGRVLSHNH